MEPTLTSPGMAVVGAGFLGSLLLSVLRERGASPVGIDPVAPADFPCRATELPAELPPQAFGLIFCCQATHGGDTAAYRACYGDTVRELNRRFPGARLIFCSSTSVYAATGGTAATEQAPTRNDSARVDILLQAEAEVLAAGGIVARLAPLYGPGRCELLRRHVAGEPRLPGPPARMLHYLHRADAVAALLCLAEQGRPRQIYNVCSENLRHEQAYLLLERCTGRSAAATCSPPGRRGLGDIAVDCSRMSSLGWAPRHTLETFFRHSRP